MPVDLLIRNGMVVCPNGVFEHDLAIDGGKIVEIGPGLSVQTKGMIDAKGQVIFPGVIDSHVHFNEPGLTHWEGIETGSSALAAGGGTCFIDMPLNSLPPVVDGWGFELKLQRAKSCSHTDFALWGGIIPSNIDDLETLAELGVVGFKAFMSESGLEEFPRADSYSLFKGMCKAAELGLPVAVHAENQDHIDGMAGHIRFEARYIDAAGWHISRPQLAEIEAIGQAILLAHHAGCRLHIVHVSTLAAVQYIALLRQAFNVDVTCETCPHYLTLGAGDVARLGASAKCAPPLREDAIEGLWEAFCEEMIQTIGSDHSPCSPECKAGDFPKAWGGIAGVQSTLPLLLTEGHHRRGVPLTRIAHATAQAPASLFQLQHKSRMEEGYDADLAIVNLYAKEELRPDHLLQRHKTSPYIGMKIHGLIQRTILRGRTIFADGKIIGAPGGQFIRPQRG